jgi:protein JSN1
MMDDDDVCVEDTEPRHELDGQWLRDLRRRIESPLSTAEELDSIIQSFHGNFVTIAKDTFGNVLIQKLIERASQDQLKQIAVACLSNILQLGLHRNGTWVIQRLLDRIQCESMIRKLVKEIKPNAFVFLRHPVGNYVIQGCIRFGSELNNFVFETLTEKCEDILKGKFGSRAMRACLESPHCTLEQQVGDHIEYIYIYTYKHMRVNANLYVKVLYC